MSSPLSTLFFHKINNFSCIIKERDETINAYPNGELESKAFINDAETTAFLFLCALLEYHDAKSELVAKLKGDLMLTNEQKISTIYPDYSIVQKYVDTVEILQYNPALIGLNDLPISQEKKRELKDELTSLSKINGDDAEELLLYDSWFDLEGEEQFSVDIINNIQRLAKYLSGEQLEEIRPGYTFKLSLKEDYLINVENELSCEAPLDSWVCEWLDR